MDVAHNSHPLYAGLLISAVSFAVLTNNLESDQCNFNFYASSSKAAPAVPPPELSEMHDWACLIGMILHLSCTAGRSTPTGDWSKRRVPVLFLMCSNLVNGHTVPSFPDQ